MSDPRTIGEFWQSFEERMVPADADDTDRLAAQYGFYAGAIAALGLLLDGVPFELLRAEVREFSRQVERDASDA